MIRPLAVVGTLAIALPGAAAGQSSTVLVAEGIAAYRDLEFGTAIGLLERALAPSAEPTLEGEQHIRTLMYLGAAQLFADRADQSANTFQELVAQYPTFHPDTLVFPPRVTQAFTVARTATKAAVLHVPARRTFLAADSTLPITIEVSSPHLVTVVLEDTRGRSLATIANERVEGRREFAWNGLDADGRFVPEGDYRLRAFSATAPGTALRSVAVPLRIRHHRLPLFREPILPVDSLLPEIEGGRRTPLALTALAFGGLVALPVAFDTRDHAIPRLAIGGALTVAGIVELITGGSMTTISENQARNAEVREEHRRAVAAVRRQNEQRSRLLRIQVSAGAQERREGS